LGQEWLQKGDFSMGRSFAKVMLYTTASKIETVQIGIGSLTLIRDFFCQPVYKRKK